MNPMEMHAEIVNAVRRPRNAGPFWQPNYAYIIVSGATPQECAMAAQARCAQLGERWQVVGINATGYEGRKASTTIDLVPAS